MILTLGQKIMLLRRERKLSRDIFVSLAKKKYKKEAFSKRTLSRIENDETLNFKYIRQMCGLLNISSENLFKDTNFEYALILKNLKRIETFAPSHDVVSSPVSPFRCVEYVLKPKERTPAYQLQKEKNARKLGYVITGTLTLILGKNTYILKRGDTFDIKCELMHSFENNAKTKLKFITFQNPKSF